MDPSSAKERPRNKRARQKGSKWEAITPQFEDKKTKERGRRFFFRAESCKNSKKMILRDVHINLYGLSEDRSLFARKEKKRLIFLGPYCGKDVF